MQLGLAKRKENGANRQVSAPQAAFTTDTFNNPAKVY
jgi:hypothetical protein